MKMDRQKRKDLTAAWKNRRKTGGIYVIENTVTGERLLLSSPNLESARNLFAFSQATGSCAHPHFREEWAQLGGQAFALAVLETLEQKEEQSDREFAEELALLLELWQGKEAAEEAGERPGKVPETGGQAGK